MATQVSKQRPVCPVGPVDIPGCDTGPAGRVAFVVRELAGVVRRRRARGHEESS